ncbi:MAG TPA: L-lactate permease [Nitriliruptoraceae bacterium]|nr:L-lactate permease [Nitriliruptoraceae bacterium]
MTLLQWLTALMPVLSAAVLLVGLRMPASRAMPLALVVTAVLTRVVWLVPNEQIAAAIVEGLVIGGGVLFIVAGALALLEVMRASGGLDAIRLEFQRVSLDSRVQMLLIAWLFVSFMEGAAGFGTPAPVAAPLLIALGFPALGAAALALIGDSSAVTFGAVGTPMIVGMGQGLDLPPTAASTQDTLVDVALTAAGIDIAVGLVITISMLVLLTRVFSSAGGRGAAREALPLAVFAALAYSVPAFLWTVLLGAVEFGAILGGITGMVLLVAAVRKGFLVPSRTWSVTEGFLDVEVDSGVNVEREMPVWKVWAPYLLLVVLLMLSRLVGPVKSWLQSISLDTGDILGTGISASWQPLYSPGAIFFVVAAATVVIHRLPRSRVRAASRSMAAALLVTGITLATSVPLVRVFLNSGVNAAGLLAMPVELATAGATFLGALWPLFAPVVGALGSFVSGSATFSHLMFAQLQADVAAGIGADQAAVLAQQVGGANAGNMVCVANVVAVAGVTGQLGKEGLVISRTVVPMLAYITGFAVVGFVLVRVF